MSKKLEPINLLELKPRQKIGWETAENGQVVLIVPKFRNRFLVEWLVPHLSKPNFRIKLDAFGSFVWKECAGQRTVAEIADKMKAEFGAAAEPVDDRVSKFLRKLEHSDFIELTGSDYAAQVEKSKPRISTNLH